MKRNLRKLIKQLEFNPSLYCTMCSSERRKLHRKLKTASVIAVCEENNDGSYDIIEKNICTNCNSQIASKRGKDLFRIVYSDYNEKRGEVYNTSKLGITLVKKGKKIKLKKVEDNDYIQGYIDLLSAICQHAVRQVLKGENIKGIRKWLNSSSQFWDLYEEWLDIDQDKMKKYIRRLCNNKKLRKKIGKVCDRISYSKLVGLLDDGYSLIYIQERLAECDEKNPTLLERYIRA